MNTFCKAIVGLFLLCCSMSAQAQLNAYGTVARVNGVDISNESLERNFEEYQRDKEVNIAAIRYPNRVTMMRREVLESLITQELIWQAAQEFGAIANEDLVDDSLQQASAQFNSQADFVGRLAAEGYTVDSYREHLRVVLSAQQYLASVASEVTVSDAECHEFYVANPEKFALPEAVHARHILLQLKSQTDVAMREQVQERALELLARLEAGEDFAALAVEASQDSSAAQGGELGYFPRGKMVKSFEDAAFALQPGEISGIVESPFGLHIIKVEDHQSAQTVPEALAKERIKAHLLETKRQQSAADEIATLRASATIEHLTPQ